MFLKNVQAGMSRALLVDGFTVSAVESEEFGPGHLTGTLTGRVFVFVDPTSVEGTTDAAAPAPAVTG